jgi:phenylpropionate dioxygenase-like ring-hydroxylating dioxygenase large terminal subunit
MAVRWTKPAEGSWTQHYPELGIEDTPDAGSYITKHIEAANAYLIQVKGHDGRIRVFHNTCRRRGHPLVSTDPPGSQGCTAAAEFVCAQCGWRYATDGKLRSVPDADSYFGLDTDDYGLVPVHCDI